MRLLHCSIENFGTLSHFERTFDAGLSVLLENNGFGKTTLAAFIKAMFYGLPSSTKRSLDENERKRYTPWQGGVFGGSLDFETGGRAYRIERRFEVKEKDDVFTLIDLQTGEESDDYSENIGEELFGLDAESFARSTYLSQRSMNAGMTTGISAKLTDMVENTGDVNNYDAAMRSLEDRRRFYGLLRGAGGETARLANEQAELARRLEQQKVDLERLEKYRVVGEQCKAMLPAVEEELASLRRQKDAAAEQRVTREVEARRAELRAAVQLAESKEKRYITLFSHGIPPQDELEACRELAETDAGLRHQIESMENDRTPQRLLEEVRSFFKNNVPAPAELEKAQSDLHAWQELDMVVQHSVLSEEDAARLEKLQARFTEHPLTREDISAARRGMMEYEFIVREKKNAEDNLRMLEQQNVEAAHPPVGLWVLAALCGIAGVALMVLQNTVPMGLWLGAGAVVLALVLVAVAIAVGKKRAEAAADALHSLQKRIEERRAEVGKHAEVLEETAKSICDLTAPFGLEEVNSRTEPLLQQLDEELAALRHLEEAEARYARVRAQCLGDMEEPAVRLDAFFGRYFSAQNLHYGDAMREVTQRLDLLQNRENAKIEWERTLADLRIRQEETNARVLAFFDRYSLPKIGARPGEAVARLRDSVKEATMTHEAAEQARAVLKKFTEQYPAPAETELLPLPEEVEQKELAANARRDELLRRISACDSETARMDDAVNALEETEAALEAASTALEEARCSFDTLTHTIESLEKARTNLNVRYKDVIAQRFNEYMQQVDAGFGAANLDANLRVSARRHGAARPAEALSEGYRALVDVCLRLSLIDALFPEEKPFLILDDPFATLDAEKIRQSLRVLYDLAKERQIIYLVCHESRA